MKVYDLIEKLNQMNGNAEVLVYGEPNDIYFSVNDCWEQHPDKVCVVASERNYFFEAIDELKELIDGLRDLGTFEMKSVEEFVDKVRHTPNLLDDYRTSDLEPDLVDVHYKDIETTIYFSPRGKVKVDHYVMFWTEDDEEEPYEYYGTWYKEQRDEN